MRYLYCTIWKTNKQTKNNHFHLVEVGGKKTLESVWMQENIYDDYMKDGRMEKVMQT